MTDNIVICPKGYYCPQKSINPTACPQGTYNPTTMSWDAAHCLKCPPGYKCSTQALTELHETNDKCTAGYFCAESSISAQPVARDLGATPPRWGPCPVGHYCPIGTAYPYKCPIGTYNDQVLQTADSACKDCAAGYFGETTALSVSTCTGKCAPGYFCVGKATTPTPTDGTTGNICTKGNYCPEGATAVTKCAAGTYNHITGQKVCLDCPAGFYCLEGQEEPA